ncbi:putative phosphatase YwpJ [Caloramator mitchellensis]|uniref:Putative phosphatase YwpJ n=1 Tax=Caloramator mitchellensis TaxID=908809 RepID=A0A0R3JWR2_CALMK|nr:Cof-type HAD-IIB family hydrolase [Caloramator mitchellensis]KRQ88016.1 putative phosphatase YwpJ [Caloramator mitchellensis]
MKYKMIAMDMDGTLLNSKKEITERTKLALKKADEKGVKLVVCTGRIFTSALYYANLIGTKAPIIASNGAYIREKDNNNVIYEKALDKDYVEKIVIKAEGFGFYPHIFTTETIYSKKLIYSSKNYTLWNEKMPKEERVKIKIVDDLIEIAKKHDILKIVVMSDDVEKLFKLKQIIKDNFEVSVFSSFDNNFEVMARDISKGNAVKVLADFYGFNLEEVVCIGDNENDISMIQYAGLGVAMANATEELKSVADLIIDSNDNEGVAKFIEEYIL